MSIIPGVDVVAQTLKTLLRRKVTVTQVTAPMPAHTPIVGVYKAGDGALVAACLCDVSFAAYSGAAFSLIPGRVAEESIRAGRLDEALEDNYGEVLNVLSRLFAGYDNQRVTLAQRVFPPAPLSAEVADADPARGLDVSVDIDGYGEGVLSLRRLGA